MFNYSESVIQVGYIKVLLGQSRLDASFIYSEFSTASNAGKCRYNAVYFIMTLP